MRTLTFLCIMINYLYFSVWKSIDRMPQFTFICRWHTLYNITELLHLGIKLKKISQFAKIWRFLWECRNMLTVNRLCPTNQNKQSQCNCQDRCHRDRFHSLHLSKSVLTGWRKKKLREHRLHSTHKMARWDIENKSSNKTQLELVSEMDESVLSADSR